MRARRTFVVLSPKLLSAGFKLRIGKGEVETGGRGCLGEPLSKDLISLDTKAGAVPVTCKLQEYCNGLLRRSLRESQPLAVVPDGATWNSVKHDLGRTAAAG